MHILYIHVHVHLYMYIQLDGNEAIVPPARPSLLSLPHPYVFCWEHVHVHVHVGIMPFKSLVEDNGATDLYVTTDSSSM